MANDIDKVKRSIRPILKRYSVAKAAIFGSTARGEARMDSDLDLLVEFNGRKTLLDLGSLYNDLEEKLDRKVDIVTYRSIDPRLRRAILAEKVDVL